MFEETQIQKAIDCLQKADLSSEKELILSVLEKQIPGTPEPLSLFESGCPDCSCPVDGVYCKNCGKRIRWY